MTLYDLNAAALDAAVRTVAYELCWRRRRSRSWHELSEEELWYELAACILGSAVSYEQAASAVQLLSSQDLLRPPRQREELPAFEMRIASALSGRTAITLPPRPRYRFPMKRARQLRLTAGAVYFGGLPLAQLLRRTGGPRYVRAELVRMGVGVGPKQASLFLRNVAYAEFAVLDRHVARFMSVRGLVSSEPVLNTLSHYERTEASFLMYARSMAVPVAELDLAVWLFVRFAKRGFPA